MTPPVIPELSAPPAEPSDGVDVKEAAAAITKAVLTPETPEKPPETPPVETVTPPAAEVPPEVTPPVEGEVTPPAEPAVTPTEVAEIAAEKGVPFADVVEALSTLGIAVEAENVPEALHDQFGALLENTRAAVAPVFAESQKHAAAAGRMKAFEERLEAKPESILLTLWATKREAFNKVAEIAAQAKDDPELTERLLRELEVEARESRVTARETAQADDVARTRGFQAASKTQEAARRHGVDPEIADRYIAGMIKAEGPESFDIFGIDKLVAQLKPAAPTPPAAPVHKTPEEVAAAAATPTTPAAPVSPPAPVRPGTSSGFDTDANQPGRGGFIKSLVRAAGGRVDQSLRGG